MSELDVGRYAPEFCLPNQDGEDVCLRDLRGKWVILYFYPKDNTPGCTREAIDFSGYIDKFKDLNSVVIGISPDSIDSHKRFIDKNKLRIILLSDVDREVIKEYGVWGSKKRFGKAVYGVIRSTFIIDPDGRIVKVWRNVRVSGHVEEVYKTLKSMVK